MTWSALRAQGEEVLAAAHVQEATHDAMALLLNASGMDAVAYAARAGEEASEDVTASYQTMIERRAGSEPLQYIIGTADFYGHTFAVGPGVLIPRFDSEVLVQQAVSFAREDMAVLDLCCGSGCLLLSLMKEVPGIEGVGLDRSREAGRYFTENAKRLRIKAAFVLGDLFLPDPDTPEELREWFLAKRFDMILCNPPYIAEETIDLLDKEVKDHEPHMALCGGLDGLSFYRRIIPEAMEHLKEGGTLLLEIGDTQKDDVLTMMEEAGYKTIGAGKDLRGLDRIVWGQKG